MSGEAKKLHLIQELLKVSDEAVLAEVESIISKSKLHPVQKKSFQDFTGKISDEELMQMEQAIEQGCEQINKDDWK